MESLRNFFWVCSFDRDDSDKIFLVISNLYFFYRSKGMQIDFSTTFHLVLVPDFIDVFLIRVVAARHEEYLVKEPRLDILAFSLFSLYSYT
jgi:hypothetical protein